MGGDHTMDGGGWQHGTRNHIYTDIDAHIRACMNIDKRNLKAVFEDNVYIGFIELVILDEKCKVERRPLHFADILRKEWQKKS